MIKAEVPQDVTEYKEQFLLGMTGRQIACVAIMLILAIITFMFGRQYVTTDVLVYMIMFEVAPLAAVGFLKYNGMGLENIITKITDFYFGVQRRKMKYLPPETEIHDAVRKIYLASIVTERKKELKRRKYILKRIKKLRKKHKRKKCKKCRKQ